MNVAHQKDPRMTTPTPYPTYSVVGDRYTFLVTGAETDGAYAVFDAWIPAGGGSPPHVHHRENEAFYVVEGDFEFTIAGEPVRVSRGGFLFGPRGVPHNFKNIGSTPGTIVITVTPAGFEGFFAEIGARLESRAEAPVPPTPADFERLMQTAPKYGLEILPPH